MDWGKTLRLVKLMDFESYCSLSSVPRNLPLGPLAHRRPMAAVWVVLRSFTQEFIEEMLCILP